MDIILSGPREAETVSAQVVDGDAHLGAARDAAWQWLLYKGGGTVVATVKATGEPICRVSFEWLE